MDRIILLIGVLLLAYVVIGADLDRDGVPPVEMQAVSSPNSPDQHRDTAGNGSAQFMALRSPDGHFYADVRINGADTRMLIDTGATTVLLSRADAQRAGISAFPGEFTERGRTVGGEIALKPVTVGRIALGPVASTNVPAMIAEDDVPVSLLGQSFLERVGRVEIEGDRLVLR